MAGLAQVTFDLWATAVETALGAANSLDPLKVPVPSKVNATIYEKMLKDFNDSFDTWAAATAVNLDVNEGDSRKRVSDQTKHNRTQSSNY